MDRVIVIQFGNRIDRQTWLDDRYPRRASTDADISLLESRVAFMRVVLRRHFFALGPIFFFLLIFYTPAVSVLFPELLLGSGSSGPRLPLLRWDGPWDADSRRFPLWHVIVSACITVK